MTFEKRRLKQVVDSYRPITYGIVQCGPDVSPNGIPYVRPVDMGIEGGVDVAGLRHTTPEIAAPYSRSTIHGQDLVVSIGPSFGKVMVVPETLTGANLTQGTARVAPGKRVHGRFLFWALRSTDAIDFWSAASTGATFASLTLAALGETTVPCPSLPTQRAIADFLDRKTKAIDDLIAKKERLIELLEEKRAALINQAVTKGLDPNVPMKDSGIPWIGEIPAHWDVRRLKFLVCEVVDCLHSTPTYTDDGEYPAIRTADIAPGILDSTNARKVDRDAYLDRVRRSKPRSGDIIYSREGERFGMAAPVPDGVDLCMAQRVMQLRPRRTVVSAFLMWALNSQSVYHQASQDTVGATSPRVNMETVANMWLALPPAPEQHAIASHIAGEAGRTRQVAAQVVRQIALLREYRQSLITAAVTGQLDIKAAEGEAA